MPAATQHHPHAPRLRNGEPQPAPVSASEPARRDLTSWWRAFSKRAVKKEEEQKGKAPSWKRTTALCIAALRALYLIRLSPVRVRLQCPHHFCCIQSLTPVQQKLHHRAFSVCPSSKVYPMRTSRFHSSTSMARATYMVTYLSWLQSVVSS